MTRLSLLARTLAVAIVVAGALLFTLAVQGVTRVDTRLELAAAQQTAPLVAASDRDCPFRHRDRDREPV